MIVTTSRLELIPLAPALVAALVAKDLETARRLAPFPIEDDTFEADEDVLSRRHAQLTADPTEEPWLYRAALLRETGRVVGRVGFHAPPDAAGAVEIGYSVAPTHRRQGLATEMAVGLIRWGAEQGARTCIASVRPDNTPSLAIIDRLGFVRTGEQMDEIDGLEWVFELDLSGPLPSCDGGR
ncbi:MAG: [ribosomal protein S5]-alanine N-acetyltransferase [Actinomycetota bacterium]|jgi:RimJ/RimL family protein N-acetyltransferase|nr:[ribosomal protein S5]-alanine N-acetyltransferase [Actinomycetota bacterium]